MHAYAELTGRVEPHYRHQLIRFIPPMDRLYLKDFYEKQAEEIKKAERKRGTAGGSHPRRR